MFMQLLANGLVTAELDPELAVDETIGALGGTFRYPFRYGYSCVGVVEESRSALTEGTVVFAFHPHQDRFVTDAAAEVLVAPEFDWEKRLLFAEHHQSHAASAFYASPFDEAAVLTMDGVGEWATTSVGVGEGDGAAGVACHRCCPALCSFAQVGHVARVPTTPKLRRATPDSLKRSYERVRRRSTTERTRW